MKAFTKEDLDRIYGGLMESDKVPDASDKLMEALETLDYARNNYLHRYEMDTFYFAYQAGFDAGYTAAKEEA